MIVNTIAGVMTNTPGTTKATALDTLLDSFEVNAQTEREKGTNFEDLIVSYLQHEPRYKDLYETVWTYAKWAAAQGITRKDTGIDLVAQVRGSGEFHAIQCKNYRRDHSISKSDIDSFFTASGKKPFTHRIIVATTDRWTDNANEALEGQQTPVIKITRSDLENSQIDWTHFQDRSEPVFKKKNDLREHQKTAVAAVITGLKTADRGKLIMACGSGKTFAALKIAEEIAGAGGRVLFLVPSLNLLSQTLTEWTQQTALNMRSFAVCSDSDVGKKKSEAGDDVDVVRLTAKELNYPATTEPLRLAEEISKRHDSKHMSVVFSTYHSIDVISKAQKKHALPEFDLIICDEAHRTTGATFESEDESAFVKVHDAAFIRARKRMYMTATPRIYGDIAKASAEQDNITICSMDDEKLYGAELHTLSFSEAVKLDLLVDYKVIVLAIEESHISRRLQNLFKDENNQLKVDDAAKIVGCWKALSKQGLTNDLNEDDSPMHRAVAFCQVIEISKQGKAHRVSSKQISSMFQAVVEAYQASEASEDAATHMQLICEAEHVDGGMNASTKTAKLDWLKAEAAPNTCRILSNVRCLSEGVDVPALDAVLFLTPRNSQIDVVQSVGRVMRKSPGKKRGYVILPVVTPAGIEPHEALNNNKTYAVVWQVLQALRSHDDRFDAMVNKLELVGPNTSKMEIIAITDKIQKRQQGVPPVGKSHGIGAVVPKLPRETQGEFQYEVGELAHAIFAKLVLKVGNRRYWEEWAGDIAKIARTHIDRITGILENPRNTVEKQSFAAFASELRDDLNQSISDDEVIEMLAQHLITKPVFDALFDKYSFTRHNPISIAMQRVLDTLQAHHIEKESDTLKAFYSSVQMRAEGIDNAAGKQKIVYELYDKFFRNAFPKMTERLGIVYTPVEVVDFILHSVDHILKSEFGQSLGSEGVHILDPFTGTGTFITRLLQSGLIPSDQLARKYQSEIRANEIVLLAYYIAAINIEAVYHSIAGGEYQPFKGICLTDTFQLYEAEDLLDALLLDNSDRRKQQKALDIRVIVGNPPYSIGQASENDNNQNVGYPQLDQRIRGTYAAGSNATNQNALYDSYIRAIRWASDRIGKSGVIGFVTNAGWLKSSSADGLRKALAAEFSSLYVFHLRGNQRTSGELSRQEGGKIFGSGSRAPIAISLLVKNPSAAKQGQIHFHHVGDYLNREEKLGLVAHYKNIAGITAAGGWQTLTPDDHGDWLNQRDETFGKHIVLGDKSGVAVETLFANYSNGLKTQRDAWCYNGSKKVVAENISRMIDFYNREVVRFGRAHAGLEKNARESKVDDFIDSDATKISWTRALKQDLVKEKKFAFEPSCLIQSLYRPFTKQWLYFNRRLNEMVYQMPRIFPDAEAENRVICVSGNGAKQFSCLISDALPDIQMHFNGQCFPLYLYDEPETDGDESLFTASSKKSKERIRRSALTDEGLAHFRAAYPTEKISKEDIFYYIYGLLHSPDYRERFADNLSKEIPRIPCVKRAVDFRAFEQAGRDLAKLHVNYESVKPYRLKMEATGKLTSADYRVKKMRYGKDKDKTTLHYNESITLTGIPLEAYEYVVNGKPALDWVVERQGVSTHKESGIVNDANDWAIETMKDPQYPLDLFCRVVTVSLETMKIVNSLPKLDI